MRAFLRLASLCCATLLIAAAPPSAIRKTLETYVKAHPYAVVAMGVIDHGRTSIYLIRGTQAKGPFDESTQFQIGSIGKVFTATILAQLVDDGTMKLSDPLQSYLPPGVVAPSYQGKQITLLSLADHTSGLPGEPSNLTQANEATYTTPMLDSALSATTLSRAPGAKWGYSNFGFAVLGQVLANKVGLSYDDMIKQRILDPLGMSDTVATGITASRQRIAPPFSYGGGPGSIEDFGARGPAGSIESDLRDMLIFLRANLDAPQGKLGPELSFAQQQRTPVPEWNMSMGLAWQTVLPVRHRESGDLGGLPAGSIEKGGDTNGYSSFIALNHERSWGMVAMTNVNDNDFQQVISHAVSPATAQMPTMWALVKRQPSPLSGLYRIAHGAGTLDLSIFKYGDALYLGTPESTPAKLTRLAANHYIWEEAGLALTFRIDSKGNATGLTAVQGTHTLNAPKIP